MKKIQLTFIYVLDTFYLNSVLDINSYNSFYLEMSYNDTNISFSDSNNIIYPNNYNFFGEKE